ncbi:adenine phosphoribosyltransferase [Ornithobacterium rhinotracheale]|uniref:Adenine phosphoribosyltransferase n=1 Tax=Ornithobacterium rhinotracheale (strain ATCC 51463 / DSM 15997 / CCUG 23171 / CIP 104009 / LMG 9086) TaxID=867902 RepID=I4A0W8_ORNRL|nr:adenine phosphoribosyltransferase [Ornithobacterium rhinotracheale]AFL97602.1 PRPP-binding protein, adenine/guanine phosphoribosyltransferase [Ornithobacterium rhinotracheale DSM 15997]AIP98886.1 adenine phosphoribosyltransferase [Ornithobacterium rhinotracheale ORT-UMN 88]KGB66845.1 adenine phosphoribosyltransferase [Ornithobacterium rhinotracheale H06-030791]MCK0194993.1 adenine phosphoribosyltransferase [Ornithobacterium rhinotracheale]MCK0200509.1 adenine phosphoribosyltransferase [Orni
MTLANEVASCIRVVEDFPHKGISFKDFSGVFQNPEVSEKVIAYFADQARGKVDAVCGIESRGFILGLPIALALKVPFIMIRKKGKLPPPTVEASYELEYGAATLEMVDGQLEKGARVLIHDDVLATGGTAAACAELVTKVGAIPAQFNFLIELDFLKGREKIGNTEIVTILKY